MQATITAKTARQTRLWVLALAVVAAVGIGFGHWVVPGEQGAAPATVVSAAPRMSHEQAGVLMAAKLERMDAFDREFASVNVLTSAQPPATSSLKEQSRTAAIRIKHDRMDAEDSR